MSIAVVSPDRLLTRKQAAEILGCKPCTLAAWASTGRAGPRITKVGRLVRYRQSEIDRYLEQRTVQHSGQLQD